MKNVHSRRLAAPVEEVGAWGAACWSGGERDCFPRDVIATWRRNRDGVDPAALIPGTTLSGHGPFRFRLRAWDGRSWTVNLIGMAGWHGLEVTPDGAGSRVTHTVELAALGARLAWRAVAPAHDWAIEAMFDRMEEALRTGRVPARTTRPIPAAAQLGIWLARRADGRRVASEARRATTV